MTLKGFHIVFITFSTLLALGIGSWCFWLHLTFAAPGYLTGAVVCYLLGLALLVYGIYFYKKMKRLRIYT